jgi:hypothetical protein
VSLLLLPLGPHHQAGQFRGGGLVHAEHAAKYNALLAIAAGDGDAAPVPYAGSKFRNFSA